MCFAGLWYCYMAIPERDALIFPQRLVLEELERARQGHTHVSLADHYVARAVASSCHRCGAPLIAATRRRSLVTSETATRRTILKGLGLKFEAFNHGCGAEDTEIRCKPIRKRSAHRSGSLVHRVTSNGTSCGTSDITQHKIARVKATQASLWRITTKYFKQILYTLSILTISRGCDKKRDSQTPKYRGTSKTQFLWIFVPAQPQ